MNWKRFCYAAAVGCFLFFSLVGRVNFSTADLTGPASPFILVILFAGLASLPAAIVLAVIGFALREKL